MRFGPEVVSYRHPNGWQCLLRLGTGEAEQLAMAVFHTFNGEHDQPLEISLPSDRKFRIAEIYSDDEADVRLEKNSLICKISEDMRAVAVLLS